MKTINSTIAVVCVRLCKALGATGGGNITLQESTTLNVLLIGLVTMKFDKEIKYESLHIYILDSRNTVPFTH
jgi:hypothetical protein